ncbi:MAG: acetolactate synthase [Oscillospiraceae bacterium]|nr:acetolactate synthase [Oscillospiraceae bacterium]
MVISQINIFLGNEKGRLAEITKVISDSGIDMRFLCVAETEDFGILRLIADRPSEAAEKLKAAGIPAFLTDVVAVRLDDRPGSFHSIVQILSDADMNVEFMYVFLGRDSGTAYAVLGLRDPCAAAKLLEEKGIHLAKSSEIYGL